ncbi:hypothetical protein yberc0001_34420 [Yersinia bercovieri ATCC 43970]|uniref:Flagellar protein FliT n=3 Tax=Yersiniaceae TaxID=1903411 RepID=A0A2G4U760_YERBE|nr:hypothetical protein yberc0001_34420 [Yersinia bercovieri ATCC 43970]PHZ29155.1 flagellar protein FliT [Yersinia bercovieri]QDW35389.1 flagellar protein FliT [Yersinia sp. KBS0713]QKJ08955.1 flagellar protein FliT [Yersinia bercovieri ATCC 43970]
MVKEGKWTEFIELAEVYIVNLQALIETQPTEMIPDEKKSLGMIITSLLENEDEITKVLEERLDVLKQDISSLYQGQKCNKAYLSQFTSIYH